MAEERREEGKIPALSSEEFGKFFYAILDDMKKNPEKYSFLNEEVVGNPVTLGPRVLPATEWASKQISRATAAADEWARRVMRPWKLPTEAALAAKNKRKNKLEEAERLGKWEKAMAKVDVDEMYKTIEKVGASGFRRGIEARDHKVERVVKELQPMVAALSESIQAMPEVTDIDREKRLLAARKGMIEIGKKRLGIT